MTTKLFIGTLLTVLLLVADGKSDTHGSAAPSGSRSGVIAPQNSIPPLASSDPRHQDRVTGIQNPTTSIGNPTAFTTPGDPRGFSGGRVPSPPYRGIGVLHPDAFVVLGDTGGGNAEKIPSSQNPPSIAHDLSQSPLFALSSGLASILGLLVTLWVTQVRTIPFSLYRSLMWRKALLLSIGIGLLVFGGMKFYMQEEAPWISPLREFHASLVGALRVSAIDLQPHGPSVWAPVFLIGCLLLIVGLLYDPATRARNILLREYQALEKAQDQQLSDILRGRDLLKVSRFERRVFDDTLEYYRHVQWRFTDVVLGAPPPTFPLFHREHQRSSHEVDTEPTV